MLVKAGLIFSGF